MQRLADRAAMLQRIVAAVEWVGGQGTRAIAGVLLLGLALPPLSAVMRPMLPIAVFALLTLAFVRVDSASLGSHLRRPWATLMAVAWMMVALPVAAGLALAHGGFDAVAPEVAATLVLVAAAPPLMSTPAFAYLLRLDATLGVAILVAALIITPLTTPLLVEVFVGDRLALSARELALRLGLLLAGSFAAAMVLRRLIGEDRIAARGPLLDGLNIITLFAFVTAILDGVVVSTIERPLLVLGLLALAVVWYLVLLAISVLAFLGLGIMAAMTVGLANANRNMGLMVAAMTGAVPEVTWLFFALAQFPIYLGPQLIRPAVAALLARGGAPVPRRD